MKLGAAYSRRARALGRAGLLRRVRLRVRHGARGVLLVCATGTMLVAQGIPAPASAPTSENVPGAPPAAEKGGTVHGVVKSGATPLPGVAITATDTLTGTR